MGKHTCHAMGCDRAVAPKFFMCRPHWRQVPRKWQRIIWALYRRGQEADKSPSKAYIFASRSVVLLHAQSRGLVTKEQGAKGIADCGALVGEEAARRVMRMSRGPTTD